MTITDQDIAKVVTLLEDCRSSFIVMAEGLKRTLWIQQQMWKQGREDAGLAQIPAPWEPPDDLQGQAEAGGSDAEPVGLPVAEEPEPGGSENSGSASTDGGDSLDAGSAPEGFGHPETGDPARP